MDGEGKSPETKGSFRDILWTIAIITMIVYGLFLSIFFDPTVNNDTDGDGILNDADVLMQYPNYNLKSKNHQNVIKLIPEDLIYDNQTINFTDEINYLLEQGLVTQMDTNDILEIYIQGKRFLSNLLVRNNADYDNFNYQFGIIELLRTSDLVTYKRLQILTQEIEVNMDFLTDNSFSSIEFIENWSDNRFLYKDNLVFVHYPNMGYKFQPVSTFIKMEDLLSKNDTQNFIKMINAATNNTIKMEY
jgi:hypothetical protein